MAIRPSPGNVSSPYGWRTHPITGHRTHHDGEDIGWLAGLTLVAPTDAVVVAYSPAGGYGNRMILRSGNHDIWLCHMAAASVTVGTHVTEGQPVGTMGATGLASGVHVHWEVHVNGVRTDPAGWLASTAADINPTPIEPERKARNVATLFRKQHSEPTLYALAGSSPGTPANWLEFRTYTLAQTLAKAHGNSSLLSEETWEAWKADYLAPLSVES